MQQLDFHVNNLDCEQDAGRLRRALDSVQGINVIRVFPSTAKVRVTIDEGVIAQERLETYLSEAGFPVARDRQQVGPPPLWKNPKVLASGASGVLLLVGWLLSWTGMPTGGPLALYLSAILVGGYFFGREAIEDLIHERRIGIELLMSVAAIAAFALGQWAEAAMLVFLYSISEALEGYTEAKTRSAIRALMDLTPKTALVRRNSTEAEIPVEEVRVGDIFLVKPGQSLPTDGEVIRGQSSVNQAPVTGESVPVEKQAGDVVYAGSINGEGSLEVSAVKAFADNTISRIIQMVEEAQERKGESQRFIEKFGARYSPAVLLTGIVLAVVGPLLFAASWVDWIIRATVFIVAAAPCALVISIPVTLVASLGTAARKGVLIKGGVFIEQLARVSVVALDKTGTITRGEPEVTDVVVPEGADDAARPKLLSVAAGIERLSQHPLAEAIVRHAEAAGVTPADVSHFQSLTGAGASANVDGEAFYIGKPSLFQVELRVNLATLNPEIERLETAGNTVVVIGTKNRAWGLLAIRDTIRPNARQAIESLHQVGVQKVVMLTGDNERTAQAIADEAGIDEFHANLKPEDKVEKVRELAERYGHVAMVGDGVNDAPALAEATVGVAMGAAGTDVALETADVALMADDLDKLVYALKLARRNQKLVNQNLALSAIVIGSLVIGAVAGWFSLPIAVLGHEISEFIVIGNGLRMLRA
ncbi:MAG: cadmium-translocating P-type ATPase [Planctomycetota bacterium]|nr:MAG: cadmium-translocating P-type ATPase [Planctomycetota bacterium]REJ92125.1 MAG: cadmium-translocating P-type ATPase [Planctomycetota bacterium]REK28661.1 MAG: cadmium-translocating P-type ATPase [Planctomycetota bacterium]REK39275.1 MAG: cadmium-translocating P-type ATPase [Planctomycetota bacterium]